MKLNLAVLLSDEEEIKDFADDDQVQFLSEEEMLAILHDDPVVSEPINQPTISESGDGRLATNEPVIVIWDTKGGRKWYVGLVKGHLDTDNKYIILITWNYDRRRKVAKNFGGGLKPRKNLKWKSTK